jgi:uncharacterized protein GlcG (DUF336 family)
LYSKPSTYPVEGGIPVIVDGRCTGGMGVAGVLPEFDAVAQYGSWGSGDVS